MSYLQVPWTFLTLLKLIGDILVFVARCLGWIAAGLRALYTLHLAAVRTADCSLRLSFAKPPPSLPLEIHDQIVDMLKDSPEGLRRISAASKIFLPRARPLLFRNIHIRSFQSVMDLSPLLLSKHCTIPKTASHFEVRFEKPFPGQELNYESAEVLGALTDVFHHFTNFDAITLNLPWIYSRILDWIYLREYRNIRKFVLTGTYPWIMDLTRFVGSMDVLEVLVVNATFSAGSLPTTHPALKSTKISSKLKEIALSAQSLCLMRWMCNLETGPKELHVIRLKVDDVVWNNQHFYDLGEFLSKYGRKVAHLYVWFEEVGVDAVDIYEVLGDALYYGLSARQLNLLLPAIWDNDDVYEIISRTCRPYVRPGATVNVVAGEHIGVDEREFWYTSPSLVSNHPSGFRTFHLRHGNGPAVLGHRRPVQGLRFLLTRDWRCRSRFWGPVIGRKGGVGAIVDSLK
ncbi:hypothetical protein FA13DRAFT_1709527 [Coprinellus micaceus]|uniref:F-box domain-containing protein n=1 Tax=Coprinellus micaceus TaxID=71717 RepID=A0A4Y7TBL8_COPMI|nr:hypothetical protein FA13DRAFT_1709527 [Coprinellus micaceus]